MIRGAIIDAIDQNKTNLVWLAKEMNKSRFLIGKEEMYSPYGIKHDLTNGLLTTGELLILVCLLRLDMEQLDIRDFIQYNIETCAIQ